MHEYLVVWNGSDNQPGLAVAEEEMFGQRLSRAALEIGTDDFRISDVGPDGVFSYGYNIRTGSGAVASASANGQYLVVWSSGDNANGMDESEFEILGQRLSLDFGLFLPFVTR